MYRTILRDKDDDRIVDQFFQMRARAEDHAKALAADPRSSSGVK